jgi:hypothetical protein
VPREGRIYLNIDFAEPGKCVPAAIAEPASPLGKTCLFAAKLPGDWANNSTF